MIRRDKEDDGNYSDVFVVDTLADLLQLLANHEIWVRISDNSKLRDVDIEESLEGLE